MRPYTPKDDVQKKSYYTDRFWVSPRVPRVPPSEDEYFSRVHEVLAGCVEVREAYIELGQLVVVVPSTHNKEAVRVARDQLGFDMLTEMSAMDYLSRRGVFELFYQMLSIQDARRLRLKCELSAGCAIESVQDLFRAANFQERELYDMFGIVVNNHPFLKRILMPDDWVGHPLLKTYPLQGDEFARWYEVDKIFGKEFRGVIGPEERDAARIDPNDTRRFARLNKEVPFSADPLAEEESTGVIYQEEAKPPILDRFRPNESKMLQERK